MRITRYGRSTTTSARNGPRCSGQRRCGSGFRGCTTCICRDRASSRTRTIPPNSSASCAIASLRLPRRRIRSPHECARRTNDVPHRPMSVSARDIPFARHPATRGAAWLKESYARFRKARLAWIVLLFTYYGVLLLADMIPFIGGIAAPLLKPVFAVGFLAAAWTQERGGVPGLRQFFQGFRSNVWALITLGAVFVAGITAATAVTAAIGGGKLFEGVTHPAPAE